MSYFLLVFLKTRLIKRWEASVQWLYLLAVQVGDSFTIVTRWYRATELDSLLNVYWFILQDVVTSLVGPREKLPRLDLYSKYILIV